MPEGQGETSAREVALLNACWQGKYVRTEDMTIAPSGALGESPVVGNPFGGEGVVEKFYERDGQVWLVSDWGYEWVIKDSTAIFEVESPPAVSYVQRHDQVGRLEAVDE